jgi:ribonuclease BN (tRNA processing enzyme)
VKVTVVPSSVSASGFGSDQFLISYLINDSVAIDAGCLGFFGTALEQSRVRHVFISHTHIDHVASLPIFLENCFDGRTDCVRLYASETVIDCLRRDMFNGRIWPDFIGMSSPETPFVEVVPIVSGQELVVDGLTVTVVGVDHLVPTLGFVIDDGKTTIVIPSDTGPTDEIWRVASAKPNLKAVILEAAFPNRMDALAKISRHLTPIDFGREAAKVPPGVTFLAVHIKSRFRGEVIKELHALGLPGLTIGEFGKAYEF